MIPHNPNLPTIDPRLLVDSDGPHALADLLAQTGYVIQRRMLIDLKHVLRSGKPWLIEGPRGGGKTALGEALALACNLPCFYLQGMQGLTLDDVLYYWDREGQNQWVRQATSSGKSLAAARAEQWSREYLVLGEALGAFDLAAGCNKAEAAKQAHLARPTFYERLRRIERILGTDLDSAESRTSLHVALLALEAARHDSSQGGSPASPGA